MSVICDLCGQPAVRVSGESLYPHRPDLNAKNFWECGPCGAHVGCHGGGVKPLGRLATAYTRRLKMRAHEALDPLWRSGKMSRGAAYARLAKALGVSQGACHIGSLPDRLLERVPAVCRDIGAQQ